MGPRPDPMAGYHDNIVVTRRSVVRGIAMFNWAPMQIRTMRHGRLRRCTVGIASDQDPFVGGLQQVVSGPFHGPQTLVGRSPWRAAQGIMTQSPVAN